VTRRHRALYAVGSSTPSTNYPRGTDRRPKDADKRRQRPVGASAKRRPKWVDPRQSLPNLDVGLPLRVEPLGLDLSSPPCTTSQVCAGRTPARMPRPVKMPCATEKQCGRESSTVHACPERLDSSRRRRIRGDPRDCWRTRSRPAWSVSQRAKPSRDSQTAGQVLCSVRAAACGWRSRAQ
jgi:hypothetical protein